MFLEFYVEEPSAEAALIYLVPQILDRQDFDFDIHPFQGKRDLLRKLPDRLKAYRHWINEDWRVIVLIDRDNDDCYQLKQKLEQIAADAKLSTRSRRGTEGKFQIINRIAIEELEAWFFGDVDAIKLAYPRVPSNLAQQALYRDPDAIRGGTWEQLEKVLHDYHPGGLEKLRAAEEISQYMNPNRNRSKSFQVFRDTLRDLFA